MRTYVRACVRPFKILLKTKIENKLLKKINWNKKLTQTKLKKTKLFFVNTFFLHFEFWKKKVLKKKSVELFLFFHESP